MADTTSRFAPPWDGPRLSLDLDALAHNWRTVVAASAGQRIGAVVKNDAYGLGVQAIAPALWALGCREFWVCTFDEALALYHRALAATKNEAIRILVLNGLAGAQPEDFAAHGFVPVLGGAHELAALSGYAARSGQRLPVAIHLDTGLTRLGFSDGQFQLLHPDSSLWRDAMVTHWVTHLGRFHNPAAPQCRQQRQRFMQWTAPLPRALRSIATSSSVFAGPDWHFDHVRVGSALWGVPTSQLPTPALHPVASLHAPVLRVADVAAGTEVGYAGSYITPGPRRIATVALGYGDGLPFTLVNRGSLVLGGRAMPIVGGVAMGMVALDVSTCAPGEIQPGMWAEVYGPQQSLQTLADAAGVPANVLLTLSARLAHRGKTGSFTSATGGA